MHEVIISLASNCQQEENLLEAHRRLGQILFFVTFTEAIWTEPYRAATTSLYLNQLAYARTELSADELCRQLKQIETDMGRTAEDRSCGVVRIDLDLMEYDKERHHLKDWDRPYIKTLLR